MLQIKCIRLIIGGYMIREKFFPNCEYKHYLPHRAGNILRVVGIEEECKEKNKVQNTPLLGD